MSSDRGIVCHVEEGLPGAIRIDGRRLMAIDGSEHPDAALGLGLVFANPYIGRDREEGLRRYAEHLAGSSLLLGLLHRLRGKPLACRCRRSHETRPLCHGDLLLAALEMGGNAWLWAKSNALVGRGYALEQGAASITFLDTRSFARQIMEEAGMEVNAWTNGSR